MEILGITTLYKKHCRGYSRGKVEHYKKLIKEAMKELAKKLLEVQRELGAVKKDKENPFFSSSYADINTFIEVVKPVLNKHGLVFIQPLCSVEGVPAIKSVLIDAESGESIEDTVPMVFKDNDPQKVGSAITYYRRYALQSFLFLEAEDDDGNKASGNKTAIKNDSNLPF